METMRVTLFPPLPSCCGFSTATEQVNLYIKTPQTETLNPVVRPGEQLLWSHTSNMLFYGLAVWRGRGVGTLVSGEVYFYSKRWREKKEKTESCYRGLPVWEADLRVNLFSCLTSLSPSKTNREPKQSNQTVMLDKYTCPLNGYTPPELSFSFMITSKVRKITFFVSLHNIIFFIWQLQCLI